MPVEISSGIKLYLNPSKGQLVVELYLTEKINANVKIQSTDMTGPVQSENATINYGSLQKTVFVSSSLTSGIYMVKVVANNKVYVTQLIYAK